MFIDPAWESNSGENEDTDREEEQGDKGKDEGEGVNEVAEDKELEGRVEGSGNLTNCILYTVFPYPFSCSIHTIWLKLIPISGTVKLSSYLTVTGLRISNMNLFFFLPSSPPSSAAWSAPSSASVPASLSAGTHPSGPSSLE